MLYLLFFCGLLMMTTGGMFVLLPKSAQPVLAVGSGATDSSCAWIGAALILGGVFQQGLALLLKA